MTEREEEREVAALVKRLGDMDARTLKRYDETHTCLESILLLFHTLPWGAEDLKGA